MAKKRLSRDQKRKAKLAQRAKRHPPPSPSLAYQGSKFKTPELTPVFMHTETGIIQADAIAHHKLTDRQVRSALETLATSVRPAALGPFDPEAEVKYTAGKEEDLIIHLIRINWHDLFEEFPHPGNETLAGVLRTLLGSIETFTTPAPGSRGYISYATGFLGKMGVRAQTVSPEGLVQEEEEDPFLEVGEAWVLDHDPQARLAFLRQAAQLIASGQGERVAEVSQTLLGQIEMGPVAKELMHISMHGQTGTPLQLPE
jgi:hypothetical protein